MKMDAELKILLESKKGKMMVICTNEAGITSDKGNFKATLNEIIGDSGFIVMGDWMRVNMDKVMAFWFE